jgi:hypothetical protein
LQKALPIFDFGYFDEAQYRFQIFDCRKERPQTEFEISFAFVFLRNRKSAIENLKLLNDSVRPHQHVRRNRQTDLLRRLQIDHELELLRLLTGKSASFVLLSGLSTKNAVKRHMR